MVEKFLSKELSCVVTDQPLASVRSTSQKKETTSLALSGLRGVSIHISHCSLLYCSLLPNTLIILEQTNHRANNYSANSGREAKFKAA